MQNNVTEDIAPELLKKIQNDFQSMFDKSNVIYDLYAKARDGSATYKEANEFAVEVGDILAAAYKKNLSSDVLPDGKMYYNIAQRILNPTMRNNYNLITDVTDQVQKSLNKAASIGIKPITPELNQDRIDGLINKAANAENYNKVSGLIEESIVNFSQSVVNDAIRGNVEFQANAGLEPRITRKLAGGCCDWCRALAGTYRYPDDVPKDFYRLHRYCRCTVEYRPNDGRGVQNSHTKKWRKEKDRDKIEERKHVGLDYATRKLRNSRFRTANMSNEEFARGKKLWQKYDELPLARAEKEHVYEELDNNLTVEERESCVVRRAIGNYWYKAINLGHNQYKIIEKEPIEAYNSIVDEVLSEMFGKNWRDYL